MFNVLYIFKEFEEFKKLDENTNEMKYKVHEAKKLMGLRIHEDNDK